MEKPQRLLVGLEMVDKAVAREHYDVVVLDIELGRERHAGVALINAINVTHASSFYKPAQIKFMWEPFLGEGLVPNDGPSWKRQHKLIQPGFHKRRVDAYAAALEVLKKADRVFPCACTRRELADSAIAPDGAAIYPGTCREGLAPGRAS